MQPLGKKNNKNDLRTGPEITIMRNINSVKHGNMVHSIYLKRNYGIFQENYGAKKALYQVNMEH